LLVGRKTRHVLTRPNAGHFSEKIQIAQIGPQCEVEAASQRTTYRTSAALSVSRSCLNWIVTAGTRQVDEGHHGLKTGQTLGRCEAERLSDKSRVDA
jgi:hypothetical protein